MGGDKGDLGEIARQLAALQETISAQGRLIAALTTTGPPAPTLLAIYTAYEVHRRGDHSWIVIRNRLRPVVRLLGDLPADQLAPRKWSEYRRHRQQEVARKGRPPSHTTLNLELAATKAMLNWAALDDQGFIKTNPLAQAKKEHVAPPRKTWLVEADLQRLLAEADAHLRAFVLVAADCGLRFNEVRTLRRDHVRDGVARIPETKNGRQHTVGLTPRALAALEAIPRCLGSPYYFANPGAGGRLYYDTTIWRWFRNACERSGLDSIAAKGEIRVRPHDLRRSAATNAHNRGASLLEVQTMLNHSNPAITSQYVQRTDADAIRVAKLMAAGVAKESGLVPQRDLINKKVGDDSK